jgi:hypothetical protein
MSDLVEVNPWHDVVITIKFDVYTCCEACNYVYQTDMECPLCQKDTQVDVPGKMSNDIRDVDLAGSIRCEQCNTEFQLISNAEYALDKFQWRIIKLGKIKTSKP